MAAHGVGDGQGGGTRSAAGGGGVGGSVVLGRGRGGGSGVVVPVLIGGGGGGGKLADVLLGVIGHVVFYYCPLLRVWFFESNEDAANLDE